MNPFANHLRQIATVHKKVIVWLLDQLDKKGNRKVLCGIRNLKTMLKRLPHRFGYNQSVNLFYVLEDDHKHYFGNRDRGFSLYKNGLANRRDELAGSYLLNKVEFSSSDIIIDCGANYADLFLFLGEIIQPKNYITFEPGAEEFKVINMNTPHSTNNNIGLGNKEAAQRFHVNNKDADSSFIEPATYTDIVIYANYNANLVC